MTKFEQPVETLIGAAVLAVAIGFGYYAAQSSGDADLSGRYSLVASFNSASGISPGTDVRIAGVKVGSVSGMELDPETMKARVTMDIRNGVILDDGTSAVIDTEGLLGGAFIALEPGGGIDELAEGDEIEITQGAISLGTILSKVFTATTSSNE